MNIESRISPPATLRHLPFEFRGTASEYFGIWIVNLLLSIVTIGIYTAWAKVRRLRYFYGNTFVDGHNFEYHARPVQILIGRIVVVGILVGINIAANFFPLIALLLIVPYFLGFPWLINKSLAFNARMTSYRNVRFSFHGAYWRTLGVLLLMPLAALFTIGLLAPVASRMSRNYLGNNTGYGAARFVTDAPLGPLYGNFGMSLLFAVAIAAAFGGTGFVVGGILSELDIARYDLVSADLLFSALPVAAFIGIYLGVILAYLFYAAGVRNIAYRHTTLGGKHRLESAVGRMRYAWILLSNLFATILTLGLLRPWAAVRTWRYLAHSTAILASSSLDDFADEAAPKGNVGAAEFFDIEGIDFGL